MSQEDPLEKETATIPVFSPGETHGQKSLVGYSWIRLSDRAATDCLFPDP